MMVAVIITVSHLQDDRHPLFYATYSGRQDLVELLMEHGADVDLATKVSKSVERLHECLSHTVLWYRMIQETLH